MKGGHPGHLSSGFFNQLFGHYRSNQILLKMDKQITQNSPEELDEIKQLENLIHKKNKQTNALKKLLSALEADNDSLKDKSKN